MDGLNDVDALELVSLPAGTGVGIESEGSAGLEGGDGINLPSTENGARRAMILETSYGNLPATRKYKTIAHIEVSGSAIETRIERIGEVKAAVGVEIVIEIVLDPMEVRTELPFMPAVSDGDVILNLIHHVTMLCSLVGPCGEGPMLNPEV